MKHLYKTVKVVYDAHTKSYDVYYRTFLFWKFDRTYKYDENPRNPEHYRNRDEARESAIQRAESLLNTVEIFRKSVVPYYG